ncbi:VanW family protein [Pseudalkalibacillus decolorationis]|uniref:VanW family protein n=1 Tax=Pseudalkalibacillus decolorationis TaxID=163879 RepID=UPI002149631A|nr:VanW family protein [Pseudalkalibacillus decolorationis]
MRQLLIAGLLLLAQPVELPDSLTVTQQGQTIAIVNRENFNVPIPNTPMIDRKKYNQFTDKLEKQVYRAPINATIDDQGRIVPGQVGYSLYRQAFKEQFYNYFYSNGPSKIEVPELDIYPKVDSELLAHIRVQRIGQYVTYFNSNNKSRSHNISLSAEAIDNHVVFPNETFSFNQVVGKRTRDKGYMRAPIIVRGELSEGIGGGICQVSSTLFNAVDRAGLQIIERYSHSKQVPYVPSGRDATVSWYGPDFRFKNKYNQPILIRAKRYEGSMVITLYSSDVLNYEPKKEVPNTSSRLQKEIKTDPEIHLQSKGRSIYP